MSEYVNAHFALETLRQEAKSKGQDGPRVLILGPEDVGKTTLAKILISYAVRMGKQPLLVNLDPKEGTMSLSGTLTATAFRTILDIEEGWGNSPMSGPSTIPVKLPLAYYYGLQSPITEKASLFKTLTAKLALAVSGRVREDPDAHDTGLIIDAPAELASSKPGPALNALDHVVSEFAVSAIIVLGSERIYSDLVKRYDKRPTSNAAAPGEIIEVIRLAKSGGCVDRDEGYMKSLRAAQVKRYFYGDQKLSNGVTLNARQQQIDFRHLDVYRLLAAIPAASDTANMFLPGGLDDEGLDSIPQYEEGKGLIYQKMQKVVGAMRNCVLAVVNAEPDAKEEDIHTASVVGFLYVVDVDDMKDRITLLSPVAGRLPGRAIVWGNWPEEVIGMV